MENQNEIPISKIIEVRYNNGSCYFYFAAGLIVGQCFMIIFMFALVWYFLFADPPPNLPSFLKKLNPFPSWQLPTFNPLPLRTSYITTSNNTNTDDPATIKKSKKVDLNKNKLSELDSSISSAVESNNSTFSSSVFSSDPINSPDFNDFIERKKDKKKSPLQAVPHMSSATILEKTFYKVDAHPPESLDWFNVLIGQTIAKLRDEAQANDNIIKSLNKILNGGEVLPDFIDKIHFTELNIGNDFPIFSNCRICPCADDPTQLEARMDVDLIDCITLGIETRLICNFPIPFMAVLPVSLTITLTRFSGTLTVSFRPSEERHKTSLTFSFSSDYKMDFRIRSLIGARSRLHDLPKIAQIVESRIKNWFNDRCVEPRFQQIVLPSMWPRSKNTRQQSSSFPRPFSSSTAP